MSGGSMLTHPSQPCRECLGQEQVAEHLRRIGVELAHRRTPVTPVEVAQEIGAVAAVPPPQAGCLREGAQGEAHSLGSIEPPGSEPCVGLDHIAGDQGVLEVECGEMACRVQHCGAQALVAAGPGAGLGRGLDACLGDDGRQMHVGDVGGPVDDPGVEAEALAVGSRQ